MCWPDAISSSQATQSHSLREQQTCSPKVTTGFCFFLAVNPHLRPPWFSTCFSDTSYVCNILREIWVKSHQFNEHVRKFTLPCQLNLLSDQSDDCKPAGRWSGLLLPTRMGHAPENAQVGSLMTGLQGTSLRQATTDFLFWAPIGQGPQDSITQKFSSSQSTKEVQSSLELQISKI